MKAKPIPRFDWDEVDMVGEFFVKEGKEFFEEKWGGDDGGAGVVSEAFAFVNLGTSAQRLRAFE
jgi:hypothetical protein